MASYYVIEHNERGIAQDATGPYTEDTAYELAEKRDCMVTVAKSQATFKTQ
jgi:hypothetical protein